MKLYTIYDVKEDNGRGIKDTILVAVVVESNDDSAIKRFCREHRLEYYGSVDNYFAARDTLNNKMKRYQMLIVKQDLNEPCMVKV